MSIASWAPWNWKAFNNDLHAPCILQELPSRPDHARRRWLKLVLLLRGTPGQLQIPAPPANLRGDGTKAIEWTATARARIQGEKKALTPQEKNTEQEVTGRAMNGRPDKGPPWERSIARSLLPNRGQTKESRKCLRRIVLPALVGNAEHPWKTNCKSPWQSCGE